MHATLIKNKVDKNSSPGKENTSDMAQNIISRPALLHFPAKQIMFFGILIYLIIITCISAKSQVIIKQILSPSNGKS